MNFLSLNRPRENYLLSKHAALAPSRLKEENAAANIWLLVTTDFLLAIEIPYWGC